MTTQRPCSEWIRDVHWGMEGPPLGKTWLELGHYCGAPATHDVSYRNLGSNHTSHVCANHLDQRVARITHHDGRAPIVVPFTQA